MRYWVLLWLALYAAPTAAAEKALLAPQPNWLGSEIDPKVIKYYERTLGDKTFSGVSQGFYEYVDRGPLGIPRIIVNSSADYSLFPDEKARLKIVPQPAAFATWSCTCLDFVAGQAGGWGPECKISKYLQLPKGRIRKDPGSWAREGDYLYTPIKMRRDSYYHDSARFILDNGAGKKVDVVFRITVNRGL